jgi:hypothetical protein
MSKNIKLGQTSVGLAGRFRLDVNRDPKKFHITNINSFVPYGKGPESRMKFMTQSGAVDSLIISQISTAFKPDDNDIDNHNIQLLIQHPDVMIKGLSDAEYKELVRLNLKKHNPKFTLTNIDRVETDSYDREVKLIQARAILYSLEKPISKERLVWLCSNFGIPYRSQTTNPERYKIELTKAIDKFIQRSETNIEVFVTAIKEIKITEIKFYINELKNLGRITDIGGIFKVGERPVGATDEHIINFYEGNQELYLQHQKEVKDALAGTIMA